jgi:NTP pyrophosphatase (non-canonical NTP hydrolase)
MLASLSVQDTERRLASFRDERGWGKHHTLKDLVTAMAIEAAELQEVFLWQAVEDERALLEQRREAIEDELADVLILALTSPPPPPEYTYKYLWDSRWDHLARNTRWSSFESNDLNVLVCTNAAGLVR